MSTTTVSVVIPTIGRPSLARAIDSVRAQDFDGACLKGTKIRSRSLLVRAARSSQWMRRKTTGFSAAASVTMLNPRCPACSDGSAGSGAALITRRDRWPTCAHHTGITERDGSFLAEFATGCRSSQLPMPAGAGANGGARVSIERD
jgi:hypothetical protein